MSLNLLPQSERLLSGQISEYLSAVATEVDVDNPPDEAKLPTYIEIDPDSDTPETVRVVGVSGNTITIERGIYNGGVGSEHLANTTWKQKFSQKHWDAIIEALQTGYLTEDSVYDLTKSDADTFTITGIDRTDIATAGRKIRLNGSVTCMIVSSSYGTGATTINIRGATVPDTITSLEYAIEPESYVGVLDEDDMVSDSDKAVPTQQSVKAYVDNQIKVVGLEVVGPADDMETGDGKAFYRIPAELNGMNLIGVNASVYTAGTTDTADIQIRNVTDSQDMLSTAMTIDSGEVDTSTGATPAVIDTDHDDVATGDILAIDVDDVHATPAKGLYIEMRFQLP